MILLTGLAGNTTGITNGLFCEAIGQLTSRLQEGLRTFNWSMQIKFEHISDVTLQSWNGVDEMLQLVDRLSGGREGDDLRRVALEAIFAFTERPDESLSMFVLRRERQVSHAVSLGHASSRTDQRRASRGGEQA